MKQHAEAVMVGSELLLGLVTDTNGSDLGRRMAALGCPLHRNTVVGDTGHRLEEALEEAVERSAVVVVAGGLGPTEDDRTRFAVARVAGVELELRADLLKDVEGVFRRFGREMPASNRVQAHLPRGAEPIRNPVGTAPGFALEIRGTYLIALPGVPREFRHLLDRWVVPKLRARLAAGTVLVRILRLSGLGESRVGEALADLMGPAGNPYLGLLANPGEVQVVLTARAAAEPEARSLLSGAEAVVRARLGRYLFGADEETHAVVALRAVATAGQTLASAEGVTGGTLARWLWGAGSPAYLGGQVFSPEPLRRRVSDAAGPEAGIARLAAGTARRSGASAGLAVAAAEELPGDTKECTWIAVWWDEVVRVRSLPLVSGGEAARQRACHQALYELRAAAGAAEPPPASR